MGTARHRGVAVLEREIGEDLAQFADVGLDQVDGVAKLESDGGIHDVLRGCSPVNIASGIATHRDELINQRQNRITDDFSLVSHVVEVDALDPGLAGDYISGIDRDHADASLGLGKRNFSVDIALDQRAIREQLAHRRRPEGIAEQNGIDNGACERR